MHDPQSCSQRGQGRSRVTNALRALHWLRRSVVQRTSRRVHTRATRRLLEHGWIVGMVSTENRRTLVVAGHGMVGHKLLEVFAERGATAEWDVVVFGEEPRPAYDRVA